MRVPLHLAASAARDRESAAAPARARQRCTVPSSLVASLHPESTMLAYFETTLGWRGSHFSLLCSSCSRSRASFPASTSSGAPPPRSRGSRRQKS